MVAAKKSTTSPEGVSIPPIDIQTFSLVLVGDSPLIMHKWSEKAKQAMKDKQAKKASKGREVRDPDSEYLSSMYEFPSEYGDYGFPSVAFKAAAVSSCRDLDMKMTEARGRFHVLGELSPIDGAPKMREDMVRVGMGTADLRYRGEFQDWRAFLTIKHNATAISVEQIIKMFDLAGFAVGVGEWRPEKDGSNGMFHVAQAGEAN